MWITNRLKGHSQIHADDVPKIAEAFGMDVCDFFESPPRQSSFDRLQGEFSELLSRLPVEERDDLATYLRVRIRIEQMTQQPREAQ